MFKTSEIIAEYGITESQLKDYLLKQNLPLINKDEVSKKSFLIILPFIENIEGRIEKKLKKAEATFKYNSDKNKISIYQDDAISFLKKLPSNSVDVITTDPAYSGMNDKLKLGKGRIVGKYADKGKDNGKWFGEFKDSEENYNEFLSECKRVLKNSTGHIYIMFDSYSLLSLGAIVRSHFDVKNLIMHF